MNFENNKQEKISRNLFWIKRKKEWLIIQKKLRNHLFKPRNLFKRLRINNGSLHNIYKFNKQQFNWINNRQFKGVPANIKGTIGLESKHYLCFNLIISLLAT